MRPIRIAIAFDYDETLGADSTTGYLASEGVDTEDFWVRRVGSKVADGWDPVLAYMSEMVAESDSRPVGRRFTKSSMVAYGRQHPLNGPAGEFFGGLRRYGRQLAPNVEVDFFIVSSGLRPIVASTSARRYFRDIWASDFEYNAAGEIDFPRNVISFTDKTRYLFQIQKGIFGEDSRAKPLAVNQRVDGDEIYVPMSRMIYVGDGMTDIPCFSLLSKNKGFSVAVFNPTSEHKWREAWGYVRDSRVNNLLPAGLAKTDPLFASLKLMVRGIVMDAVAQASSALR